MLVLRIHQIRLSWMFPVFLVTAPGCLVPVCAGAVLDAPAHRANVSMGQVPPQRASGVGGQVPVLRASVVGRPVPVQRASDVVGPVPVQHPSSDVGGPVPVQRASDVDGPVPVQRATDVGGPVPAQHPSSDVGGPVPVQRASDVGGPVPVQRASDFRGPVPHRRHPGGSDPALADLYGQELRYACPAGCSCDIFSIGCHYRELTVLPPMPTSGASEITVLYIHHNSLPELPDRGLQSLSGLTDLRASLNKVTLMLRRYSFYGLWKLRTLLLYKSNIEYLPDGVFHGLSKLRDLWLSGNNIHRLSADGFNSLPLLTDLNLDNNQVALTVEDYAFRGVSHNIRNLNITGCQGGLSLARLAFYGGLENVTEIQLQYSKLTIVKSGTFQDQPLLKVVYLNDQGSGKELGLEPGAFNGSVHEVYLAGNHLTSLPAGLFSEGSKISKLDLSNNNLTVMPRGVFSPLKKLSYLDLRGNHFVDCHTLDELKEMSLTTLAHDSCALYSDVTSTTTAPGPSRPCNIQGAGIPPAFNLCPTNTNDATICGADASSNCCWLEVNSGYGLCIVTPSGKTLL